MNDAACMTGRLMGDINVNSSLGTVWTTYKNEMIYASKVVMRILPGQAEESECALSLNAWLIISEFNYIYGLHSIRYIHTYTISS